MSAKTKTYNPEQVFNPDDSVFVSANAGAGKTSLLTNRVLALLLHGVAPSKILCLTFTNAAAAEMANRVQSELGKWVMMDDETLSATLTHLNHTPDTHTLARARSLFAQVLESPEGVRIQTLHGLCQSLLRRFPVEAGISPYFSIMDSRTEQEVMHEARQRLFSRALSGDESLHESLLALSQTQAEDTLRQLLETIIRHRRAILPLFYGANPTEAAISMVWNLLKVPKGTTTETLLDTHFRYTDTELQSLRAIATLQLAGEPKRDDKRTGMGLAAWLENQHDRENYIQRYGAAFIKADGEPYKSLTNKGTLSDTHVETLHAELQRVLTYHNAANSHAIATRTTHMLVIAEALLSLYAKLKDARALMDYEDLIMTARSLLDREDVIPWVLYKLDGGIDHLLVDEAQDTSPEQWSIINALTQEFYAGAGRSTQSRSMFVVGDEKQSIFSFQGADPRELGKAQSSFTQRIKDAGQNAHAVELIHSFRSTNEILQAVDAIFALPQVREGLTYKDIPLAHIPTRGTIPGLVELWPAVLRTEAEPETEEETTTTSNHIILARTIADTIKEWLDSGLMLESKSRPVQAGDIMILVAKRKPLVDPLVRALKKRGVPVSGHDRMQLEENLAVQDLIALGQCLLLPEDNLTLASLLKSPLFALTEHELFQLAHGRESSLWDALQTGQGTSENTSRAYMLLTDLRARADYISPYELYSYLLENKGGRNRITGRMGEEYHDPLDEFLGLALLYERAHTPSLQGFIHWLCSSESQIKRDMEQAQGCVRILTVHASKGLEAPIVILPDTTRKPDMKDMLLWHEGEGFRLPFWPGGSKGDDNFCANLRQKRYSEIMAESRRLFYVALTRARDRLYICGAVNAKKISEGSWYEFASAGLAHATHFDMPWGEGRRFGTPPTTGPKQPEILQANIPPSGFHFLTQPAPAEPIPPQPLAPSRLVGEEPAAASPLNAKGLYARGTLIHQLLQFLPQVPQSEQAALAKKITTPHAATMPADVLEATIAEALRVISTPEYAFIFGASALAEVPVAGLVNVAGKKVAVSGQIDRLFIGEKEIWIVDFKSNHTPPDAAKIPASYIRQMRLYQLLLQQIYPDKSIRCALLWTALPAITALPQSLLDEVPASSYI